MQIAVSLVPRLSPKKGGEPGNKANSYLKQSIQSPPLLVLQATKAVRRPGNEAE